MRGYIPTLDGWRAVAILGVLVFHSSHHYFAVGGPYSNSWAALASGMGEKGVYLFFAISGFLICTRLLQEGDREGHISLKGFYVRRAFRILPPILVYLATLLALAGVRFVTVSRGEIAASLFFFRNYAAGGYNTAHFWSLSVEEHFYLLFPLLLVCLRPRRARHAVLVLALCVAGWRWLDGWYHFATPGALREQRTDWCADGLLWGCWAALVMHVPAYRQWVQRRLNGWVWLLLVAAYLVSARRHSPLTQAVVLPWLLLGTALRPSAVASRVLENPLLRWVGKLSYSLYVWQQLFLRLFGETTFPPPLDVLQVFPLNWLMTFAVASMSYYWVEAPLLRWGHRLSERIVRGKGVCVPAAVTNTSGVPG